MKENTSISTTNLEIPEGMKAETRLVSIEQSPRYYKIGNGVKNTFMGKSHEPIDTIDTFAEMTPQELWMIKLLKDNLVLREEKIDRSIKLRTSCKSYIKSSELTSAEKQKFKAGYKRLKEKNLVKRIKREHYMFNPDFFIPHFYQDEKELFDSLK